MVIVLKSAHEFTSAAINRMWLCQLQVRRVDGLLARPSCRYHSSAVPESPMILHRGVGFYVVSKPAGFGLLCGKQQEEKRSLEAWLQQETSKHNLRFCQTFGQLERAASGIAIIASSRKIDNELESLCSAYRVAEVYRAIVRGNLPLHDVIHCQRRLCRPSEGCTTWRLAGSRREGHEAHTFICGLQHGFYGDEPCTLAELRPLTSCPQQLRLHCVAVGHPIIGDQLHACDRRLDWRFDQPIDDAPRLMLHSWQIRIPFSFGEVAVLAVDPLSQMLRSADSEFPCLAGQRTVSLSGVSSREGTALLGDDLTASFKKDRQASTVWQDFGGGLSERVIDDTHWDHPRPARAVFGAPFGPPEWDDRREERAPK